MLELAKTGDGALRHQQHVRLRKSLDRRRSHVHTAEFSDVVPGKVKQMYLQHMAMGCGSVPEEQLLEWSVEDGWEPLCAFLGKEVPKDTPFPTSNSRAAFTKRVDEIVKTRATAAIRNLAICATILVAVGAWAYYR